MDASSSALTVNKQRDAPAQEADQYHLRKAIRTSRKRNAERGRWFSVLTSISAFIISLATFGSTFATHDKVEILVSTPELLLTETDEAFYDTVGVSLGLTVLNEGNRSASMISAAALFFLDETEDEDADEICKRLSGFQILPRMARTQGAAQKQNGQENYTDVLTGVIEPGKAISFALSYDLLRSYHLPAPPAAVSIGTYGTLCLRVQISDSEATVPSGEHQSHAANSRIQSGKPATERSL